uniref:Uncharacterized protein n=1 Tax=Strongyloides venezuelensis TaxID=75913 RepID=A0A0K0FP56_STRVS
MDWINEGLRDSQRFLMDCFQIIDKDQSVTTSILQVLKVTSPSFSCVLTLYGTTTLLIVPEKVNETLVESTNVIINSIIPPILTIMVSLLVHGFYLINNVAVKSQTTNCFLRESELNNNLMIKFTFNETRGIMEPKKDIHNLKHGR